MSNSFTYHPSSFRDPSGFIFEKEKILYRQVNQSFKEHFDLFISSGFYEKLVKQGLLIPHETINENLTGSSEWYTTLKPEKIEFISYPWEWSFDMLKDAALLTLRLAKEAAAPGMVLKDATPYNIQWQRGRLIFIDSLSFEKYNPEEPWIAYRQFCESFLAPLLLMHYSKNSLQQIMLAYPEGIPLAVAKSLLPWRTKFSLHVYLHIHLHASVAKRKNAASPSKQKFSKQKFLNLISSLEILINKLRLPEQSTAWSAYYEEASQRNDYLEQKEKVIWQWLEKLPGIKTAADLGANDGQFSRMLSVKNIQTIAADFDPYCINKLYNQLKASTEKNIQPLIVDLSNPSPAIGVNNNERSSFIARLHVDLALALALIHHLVIGKNIPFEMIADLFQKTCSTLIIEFVPKEDEKVQLMLANKKDIYPAYTAENFEKAFGKYFRLVKKETIPGSGRTLYLMTRHEG
ncbi:MAG TPA: hypothetical protein VK483_01750 [Chitinophagaceae bacterium]|nr:hypothetical protein [Chitinophagaceae bacterium]